MRWTLVVGRMELVGDGVLVMMDLGKEKECCNIELQVRTEFFHAKLRGTQYQSSFFRAFSNPKHCVLGSTKSWYVLFAISVIDQ